MNPQSDRFARKHVVVGVKKNSSRIAIDKDIILDEKVINLQASEQALAAFYDGQLDVTRVYESPVSGYILNFSHENNTFKDEQTGSIWNASGNCIEGDLKGEQFSWVPSFNVIWFAWYAFFPETQVYPLK